MVKCLSEKIADFFIGDTEEYKRERDVYVYGCEVLCSILLNIAIVCIVGLLFEKLHCSIAFLRRLPSYGILVVGITPIHI